MAPVVAIVGAAAGAGAASALGGGILANVFGGLVAFGINSVGGALFGKKPKAPRLGPVDNGLSTVTRESDDTGLMVYGRARVAGTLAYAETIDSGPDSDDVTQTGDNLFLHMVIVHACHECDAIEEYYINDDLVTIDGNGFVQEAPYNTGGKSYVRITSHLGSPDQLADSLLVAESDNWTANHRLRGLTYSYIRLQWNNDIFINGIPNLSVVARGKKLFDPRTSTTAWSNNAALCIRDYLTSRDGSNNAFGFGATDSEIDDTFSIAAANTCEEQITKLDMSTVDRYSVNGVIDTGEAPIENLEQMLTSMVGAVTNVEGKFRIHPGGYETPETTVIDESFLSGKIISKDKIERRDLHNAVRGLYVSPEKGWQSDNFPELTSPTFEQQDNDERIYNDIELPYTTDPEVAQRIARIAQLKGREQISVTMECNFKALQFAVWDLVKVNNTTRGWSEKIFRIVNMAINAKDGITLQLREENSSSYDWQASDAQAIASAPDTTLPDPTVVTVPSGVNFSSRAVQTEGGDNVYNLVLNWQEHNSPFVRDGGFFEIAYKLSTDIEYNPSFSVPGSFTTADLVNSTVNTEYDIQIRAVNNLGFKSQPVTITEAQIGTSGGVLFTEDWETVADTATFFRDYAGVSSAPTSFEDWGSVA